MNVTLTPQLRQLAVVGLAAAALLMGGLFFMTRSQLAAERETASAPVVVHQAAPATKVKPSGSSAKAKAARPSAPAKAPTTRPTVAMRLAAAGRLPFSIARELGQHRVVVAALVVPDGTLDRTVLAEAKAAAEKAGVGFVSVDVLHERAGRALAERLGVVETPAVIVYRRPAKAFLKLEGFADQATVAQAVANARGR